jgi:hypothetical protein
MIVRKCEGMTSPVIVQTTSRDDHIAPQSMNHSTESKTCKNLTNLIQFRRKTKIPSTNTTSSASQDHREPKKLSASNKDMKALRKDLSSAWHGYTSGYSDYGDSIHSSTSLVGSKPLLLLFAAHSYISSLWSRMRHGPRYRWRGNSSSEASERG